MKGNGVLALLLAGVSLLLVATPALGQHKLGYVDSEYILNQLPDYATVQQQIDRMAEDWRTEVEDRRSEVDEMFREYQARELLYTNEERQRKRDDIIRAEEEVGAASDAVFRPGRPGVQRTGTARASHPGACP